VVTAINIVFVLAAAALVETLMVVVVVPGSDDIPLPPTDPDFILEKWMSPGGRHRGVIAALSLMVE